VRDAFDSLNDSRVITANYCDVYVCVCLCVCVCLSARISPELHAHLYQIFVHVAYGRGSVLLRRRCDTLCTSGFVDDIMFFSIMGRIVV